MLTPRDTEGLSRAETAYCLGLSTHTVEAVEQAALAKVEAALRYLDLDAEDLLGEVDPANGGHSTTARHA